MIVKLELDLAKRSEVFRTELAAICEEPELLSELSKDSSISVLKAVAQNPLTPKECLVDLANYPDSSVQRSVVKNPNRYPEVIYFLMYSTYSVVKIEVAQTTTDRNILDILATDQDYLVRQAVTTNPKTRLKTLKKLAEDPEIDVKLMMANWEKTRTEIRKILMNDPDYRVRKAIASRNDNTAKDLHEIAMKENDIIVLKNIARNRQTDGETLEELARKTQEVWKIIAENPNTLTLTLDLLATSKNIDVLIAVLNHRNTSNEAVLTLKRHPNAFIRNRAFDKYLNR